MEDELLDQVDESDNIIGSVWKSKAHQDYAIIHREVALILFNNKQEVLLQQRSFTKKNNPGAWRVAAAGHPLANEDPKNSIMREVLEELGIKIKPVFYKKYFSQHNKKGENNESRFTWVYYAIVNDNPKIILQTEEVNDARWVKIDKLIDYTKDPKYSLDEVSFNSMTKLAKELKII